MTWSVSKINNHISEIGNNILQIKSKKQKTKCEYCMNYLTAK